MDFVTTEDSRKRVCARLSSDLAQGSKFDAGASLFMSTLYERCELAILGELEMAGCAAAKQSARLVACDVHPGCLRAEAARQ